MKRQIHPRKITESYENLLEPSKKNRVSIGLDNQIKEYFQINIDCIIPYKKQARKVFDENAIKSLSETIKLHGVRQPLSVIKSEKVGLFEVISGERRLKAAKLAGLLKVPCIVLQSTDDIEEIALIENIQREDLHPIELSDCYNSLLSNYQYGDITALSKRLSISKSHLAEVISYKNLPEEIKAYLLKKNIRTRVVFRNLKSCKNIESMKNYLGITAINSEIKKQKSLLQIVLQGEEINLKIGKWKISDEEKTKLKEKLKHFIETL